MFVERIAVCGVRFLLRGEKEDGACVCVGRGGLRIVKHGVRGRRDDVCWGVDGEGGPFLHGGTVDGVPIMLNIMSVRV